MNIVDQWPPSEGPLDDTIEPRSFDEEAITGPIEDLVDLPMDDKELTKVLKLGKNLSNELREAISTFLKENLDVFTWKHSDMEGIDPTVICVSTWTRTKSRLDKKARAMDAEWYQALKDEVDKLIACDFIKESYYPSWLVNPVLIKKPNDKWMTCMNFTDLNKVCPEDSFLLLRID